jgi:hypothetical protein
MVRDVRIYVHYDIIINDVDAYRPCLHDVLFFFVHVNVAFPHEHSLRPGAMLYG